MAEKMVDGVTKAVEYFTVIEEQVVNLVIKSLEKILATSTIATSSCGYRPQHFVTGPQLYAW